MGSDLNHVWQLTRKRPSSSVNLLFAKVIKSGHLESDSSRRWCFPANCVALRVVTRTNYSYS